MKTYLMDLRERVLEDSTTMKTRAVAAKYRVSPAWVRRLSSVFGRPVSCDLDRNGMDRVLQP